MLTKHQYSYIYISIVPPPPAPHDPAAVAACCDDMAGTVVVRAVVVCECGDGDSGGDTCCYSRCEVAL